MNGIRKHRLKHGLSQEDLADILGIDRTAITRWESGASRPRADRLIKLAKIFRCSVDELLDVKSGKHKGETTYETS